LFAPEGAEIVLRSSFGLPVRATRDAGWPPIADS
jgi:hypothetical protein